MNTLPSEIENLILDYKYQSELKDRIEALNARVLEEIYRYEDDQNIFGCWWGELRNSWVNRDHPNWGRNSLYRKFDHKDISWKCEWRTECVDCGKIYNDHVLRKTMEDVGYDRYFCDYCDKFYCGCRGEIPTCVDDCENDEEN